MMRPIYKRFKQYCQKIAIEKKCKIAVVMTEMDLLAACWPQIAVAYDEISAMIMSEEQQHVDQEEQEYPLLIWGLKRMLMTSTS